jgi:hypothetical protein
MPWEIVKYYHPAPSSKKMSPWILSINVVQGIVVGYQLKYYTKLDDLVWFMVFNATFNNISVISCQSVLLVEETGVPGENHRPVASH